MKSAAPSVAGLVLNYNGREVTLETLASLSRLDYASLDLVVIDNGSTDGSRAAIAEQFSHVRQLVVDENRGISWGLNQGMRWAMEEGYDYLLLMNNDIEVAPDMLTEMVRLAESDPAIGSVGPKSYYWADRERLWSTGGILRYRESVTRERGDGELDRGQFDRDEEVPYVNGCAMLVKRAVVERIGYWDPVYYLGVEDADYCVRMKQAGFRCWYAHRAMLWHKISASIGVYKPTRTYHTGRSSAIYLRKYGHLGHWLSVLAFGALSIPLAYVREWRHGNQAAVLRKWAGFRDGLREPLPEIPEPPRAREVSSES